MQTPAPSAAVIDELKAALGPGGWTQDPDVIAPHLTEWRNRWTGNTAILLTPRSTEEVARTVTICAREGVAARASDPMRR
jgi:FAD/FMN-containing dehydrogenase